MRAFLLATGGLMISLIGNAQVPRSQVEIVTSPATESYRTALRLGSSGDLARARQELEAVLRADPTHTSAKLRLRMLDDVRSGAIPPATAAHLFKANQLVEDGRRRESMAEIEAAVKLSPRYHEAFRLRGRERIEVGDTRGAIADYSRAIELEPGNTSAYVNRATAFFHIGDVQRSLADFAEAIRREPSNAEAYVSRGVVYSMHNARPQAMADFEKAIQLDPGLTGAYLNKAKLHEEAGQTSDAVHTLKALIRNARRTSPQHIEFAKRKLQELERR